MTTETYAFYILPFFSSVPCEGDYLYKLLFEDTEYEIKKEFIIEVVRMW